MANSSERPAHLSLRGTPDHTGMNDVDEVGGAVSPPNSRARASGLRALTGNVLKCGHAWQTVRMGDKGGVFWHTGRSHENTSIASAWSLGCKSRKEPVASELGQAGRRTVTNLVVSILCQCRLQYVSDHRRNRNKKHSGKGPHGHGNL